MAKILEELKKDMDFAYMMASIGRDTAWLPIIYDLDRQIKEIENE